MNEGTKHLYSRVMLLALLLTASASLSLGDLLCLDPSNMDTLRSDLILVSGVAFG